MDTPHIRGPFHESKSPLKKEVAEMGRGMEEHDDEVDLPEEVAGLDAVLQRGLRSFFSQQALLKALLW